MHRRGTNFVLPILAALLFALPVAARDAAKSGKPTIVDVEVLSTITLGGKQLKPGMYTVKADDSKVQLMVDGKVVAEAPVEWKDETSKPRYSQIVTTDNQVREIHFSGKMKYVAISG